MALKRCRENSYGRIDCDTDAADDYLFRDANRGEFVRPDGTTLPHEYTLRNGKLRIVVMPPPGAKVGDEVQVKFGFRDNNPERVAPLVFDVTVKIGVDVKPENRPGGDDTDAKTKSKPKYEVPDIVWVREGDDVWNKSKFDEKTGGYVNAGPPLTIYVKPRPSIFEECAQDGK